jgi:hypothetical protein
MTGTRPLIIHEDDLGGRLAGLRDYRDAMRSR